MNSYCEIGVGGTRVLGGGDSSAAWERNSVATGGAGDGWRDGGVR